MKKNVNKPSFKIALAFILSLSFTASGQSKEKEVFKISAIDWCPQICPNQPEKPGYLVEMVKDIFKDSNYKVSLEYTPWSRAIYNVRNGHTDALLSPSKEEAPDLYYHKDPIAFQTHCFWKLNKSQWNFQNLKSLEEIRFVIYRDHSYGELLNKYFASSGKDGYLELSYDDRYIDRAKALLKKKRAEAFLFTVNSVQYYQAQKKKNELKLGACIKKDPLWIPLTPKRTPRIEKIKSYLDSNIMKYKGTKKYKELLKKYNIKYPKVLKTID